MKNLLEELSHIRETVNVRFVVFQQKNAPMVFNGLQHKALVKLRYQFESGQELKYAPVAQLEDGNRFRVYVVWVRIPPGVQYRSVTQDALEYVQTKTSVVSINDLKYGFVNLRMHRTEQDSKQGSAFYVAP